MKYILDENKRKKKKDCDSVTYTTGDIGYNIAQFNKHMGTDAVGNDNGNPSTVEAQAAASGTSGGSSGEGIGESLELDEAKRYVRRYYIRPQNIFCSNKNEILKALIDLDDKNCSVYTLNNLGDEKDVTKLKPSDIIYYYDNGILYDKNKVKVMDYDLYIKHEEKRDEIDTDKVSDAEFNDVYDDRMTDQTIVENKQNLEESSFVLKNKEFQDGYHVECRWEKDNGFKVIGGFTDKNGIVNNDYSKSYNNEMAAISAYNKFCKKYAKTEEYDPFNEEFDSYNVYGEKLIEGKETDGVCCICGEPIEGYGNNAEPYKEGRCCDACNIKFVIPARLVKQEEK